MDSSWSKLTVSLHPVQRSYAAPVMSIFRNWAKKPRIWCGTRPKMLVPGPALATPARADSTDSGVGAGACSLVNFKHVREARMLSDMRQTLVDVGLKTPSSPPLMQRLWARAQGVSQCTSDPKYGLEGTVSRLFPDIRARYCCTHVGGRDNVIAIVAPQATLTFFTGSPSRSMSHDQIAIKSQSGINNNL